MGPDGAKMHQVGAKLGQIGSQVGIDWSILRPSGYRNAGFGGILRFLARKLISLQENEGSERSLGGIRRYFWSTWEQKWLLDCQVGAKMESKCAGEAKLGRRWAKMAPREAFGEISHRG